MIFFENKSVLAETRNVVIAHGVNCQGKMNAGVAKAIRETYPKAYREYLELYNQVDENDLIGTCQVVTINEHLFVANLFTQRYYGKDGRRYAEPHAIHNSLNQLCNFLSNNDISYFDIMLPRIGCGWGGLDWDTDVYSVIKDVDSKHSFNFIICDL